MQRRSLISAGLFAAITTSLGACGFRPLLSQAEADGSVQRELAAVDISGLGGRLGQQLRIALEDNLDPASSGTPPLYDLDIRLSSTNSAFAIQLDNTISRYNLTLTAGFVLRRNLDQNVLYRSSVQRVASYNQRRAPFATLTAQQDAERRAAEEIADDIRTLLALHFQREADAA